MPPKLNRLKIDAISPVGLIDTPTRKWIITQLVQLSIYQKLTGHMVISFTNDQGMSTLHKKHLNIDGTTDVLTFDLRDDKNSPVLEVEAVLCVDEAARQAKARGHETKLELLLYGIHAILHVTGFDDKTPAGHKKMHAEEDRLLQLLQLPPVYSKK
jgi:probable rRNA maturation factor